MTPEEMQNAQRRSWLITLHRFLTKPYFRLRRRTFKRLRESGRLLLTRFGPRNPHLGDAIVATFFWRGSTNVITSVTDRLSDGTPVGNNYTPVEYVTAGGISMATYLATNVQNYPEGTFPGGEKLLVVQA